MACCGIVLTPCVRIAETFQAQPAKGHHALRQTSGGKALLSLAIVAFALVLVGCGASAKPHHAAPPQLSQAERMKAVVRVWNANLNAGNNAAEARLFSYPALISLMEWPYGCLCRSRAEVVQFHAQLL
jgi:hypothetical protein